MKVSTSYARAGGGQAAHRLGSTSGLQGLALACRARVAPFPKGAAR